MLRSGTPEWANIYDRVACSLVQDFYRRWQRKGWNARQAGDALKSLERSVRQFTRDIPGRAEEILP